MAPLDQEFLAPPSIKHFRPLDFLFLMIFPTLLISFIVVVVFFLLTDVRLVVVAVGGGVGKA